MKNLFKLFLIFTVFFPSFTFAIPVVPGAFGFGMETRAAYACGTNPTIIKVTSLGDSGGGTLREALEASGPRVVIFEISGNIVLNSDIDIKDYSSCLTIAGQTAPSPGITVSGFGIHFYGAHDVLIQHLRIRPGDGPPLLPATADHDATIAYMDSYNIVWDHDSMSWAQGKNLILNSSTPGASFTVWRSITSEALFWAKNIIYVGGNPSSLGMLVSGKSNSPIKVSVFQSLFAHNSDRNPEIQGQAQLQFINNIVYDWGKDNVAYPWANFFYGAPSYGDGLNYYPTANIIGNAYIAGPGPSPFTPLYAIGFWGLGSVGADGITPKVYISDNLIDSTRQAVSLVNVGSGYDPQVSSPALSLSGITVMSSSVVESTVLANVGARPLDRDSVDTRIVNEVKNRSGGVITSQDQVGGWPNLAQNTRALTPPSNPHAISSTGYTNLEDWLHGYAAAVEGGGTVPTGTPTPNPSTPPLAGDLNMDHIVNSVDWSIMNKKWFTTDTTADINKDGLVNAVDFSLMNSNWFKRW